ncbi:MAG TPA: MucR family transcriptional regulator [Sphingomicrobium sp.]|nr:MucR family transcriptional regulator [Sphingomicrobium sp.]
MADSPNNSVDLAANLTIAWLNNPNVRANNEEATSFLQSMHLALASMSNDSGEPGAKAAASSAEKAAPAVTVRKTLASRDRIISLIDGKPYATLKRHLSKHGLTPDQYRERYGLKADYPMVAPAYAEKRRELAKKIGLGSKGRGRPKGAKPKAASKQPTGKSVSRRKAS